MRQNEARSALNRSSRRRWSRGDRTILVITGKGLKKLDAEGTQIIERGVLRSMLPTWLSEPGLAADRRRLGLFGPDARRRGRVLRAAEAGATMTPLGAKLRAACARSAACRSRTWRGRCNVSSAYLSALEHGHRGKPTFTLLQRMIAYFNVIWDEAEELQRLAELSDPKVTIDTGGHGAGGDRARQPAGGGYRPADAEDLVFLKTEVMKRAGRR